MLMFFHCKAILFLPLTYLGAQALKENNNLNKQKKKKKKKHETAL